MSEGVDGSATHAQNGMYYRRFTLIERIPRIMYNPSSRLSSLFVMYFIALMNVDPPIEEFIPSRHFQPLDDDCAVSLPHSRLQVVFPSDVCLDT